MCPMKKALLNALVWFGGISRSFAEFIAPLLAESLSSLLTSLAPIALDVVSSLADSSKSGDEKRKAAQDQIKAIAVAEGIKASSRAVNIAIELALEKLEGGAK
jgi:hypothetical protein